MNRKIDRYTPPPPVLPFPNPLHIFQPQEVSASPLATDTHTHMYLQVISNSR